MSAVISPDVVEQLTSELRGLKAGTIRVNGGRAPHLPFGGFKQSGWGRENGRTGVEEFTELKSVFVGL